jgi:predicted nucleic acid-binding protein
MRQFFDTNVLVHSQDARDPMKREIAQALIQEAIAADTLVVSTQVLAEFYATCMRRALIRPARALALVLIPFRCGTPWSSRRRSMRVVTCC